MLTPEDIRGKAERKYPDFLRSLISGENPFPIRIAFGKPSPSDSFESLKSQTERLASGNFGYTVTYEERDSRRWGTLRLPSEVKFESEGQFVRALGKEHEVQQFKDNVFETRRRLPLCDAWMRSHFRWILEYASDWNGVLSVCEYFLKNPRPNLYIRQLPIPVHSKFIQQRQEMFNSFLSAILPSESVTFGARNFEQKFGLREIFPMIRFRSLDPGLTKRMKLIHEEMGLPLDRFRALPLSGLRVVITENLMNLECLPSIPNGLGIDGHGAAAENLAGIPWFDSCDVLYWGDMDEHGFHILARLRSAHPRLRSVMMDHATLDSHSALCGTGKKATGKTPRNFTASEADAFDCICSCGTRLEQEKIPLLFSNHEILRAFSLRSAEATPR